MTLATLLVNITSNTSGLVKGVAQANAQVSGLSKNMMSTGKNMMTAGATMTRRMTVPIVAMGAAAAKLSVDFESSMTNIRALVGASDKQMGMYEDHIMGMAGTLPQAPKELADALYFVTSSGFKGAEALKVLDASAKAAAAGLGETETVADAVTSIVNAYSPAVIDAQKSTDLLFATVREGKAEPEELAGVIGRVIPLAESMGIAFEDVSGSLASLTLTGLDAAESTTALRGIFSTFAKPTKDATAALKDIGYSIPEVKNALSKDFLPTLINIRKELEKKGIEESEVFGNVRALTGFLSITGKRAGKNSKIFQEMYDDMLRSYLSI